MSTRFDDEVEAAWSAFEERLGAAVERVGIGTFAVTVDEQDGACPTRGVVVEGDDGVVVATLEGAPPGKDGVLAALGWVAGERWSATSVLDERDVLVGMIGATLRQAYDVPDPSFLSGDLLEDVHDPDEEPPPVIGFPSNAEELTEMVAETLRPEYGDDQDSDGDFPVIRSAAPIWVRVVPDQPAVHVFSIVAASVRDLRQARIEVEILNRRQRYLKFHAGNGVITASYDLPAAPFVGPQLLCVLERIVEDLDDIAADTARRVRGRLWFAQDAS
jgi:hypothetical protein